MQISTVLLQSTLQNSSQEIASGVNGVFGSLGLSDSVTSILGGLAVLIIGSFICKLAKKAIVKILQKTGIDEKVSGGIKISDFVGKLAYFFLMIIILMVSLSVMGVSGDVLKGAILVIFLAMGLNRIDLADEIVNLAFGLGLGALAVAFAISFGLGGKDVAAKEMQNFFDKFKNK